MTVLILIQFIAVESIKCVFLKQCYFNLSESLSYPSTISFSWVGRGTNLPERGVSNEATGSRLDH